MSEHLYLHDTPPTHGGVGEACELCGDEGGGVRLHRGDTAQ